MPPELILDISKIDWDHPAYGPEELEKVNPHRGAMRMIDGLYAVDPGLNWAVAYKDVREDEFWVPGHIPGRPLFPGVLMIEAAAQLASYLTILRWHGGSGFVGFTGVEKVKFRGQVAPGDRLIMLALGIESKPKRFICSAQGLVNGKMVFEGKVSGMPF